MLELFDLMVSFNIDGKIHSEIIRNPISIPVRIINPLSASQIINCCGQGNRPAGAVIDIQGNTKTMIDLVVTDEIQDAGSVVIGGII